MKKIVAFDSLRFIACLFIIWHHTGINIYGFHSLPYSYFLTAGLAVEIFFVLSGFLLAKSYYKSLNNGLSAADNCKNYFFNRIKRLYPEYIFAMLLCALLTNLFSHHISMRSFMLNVFMLAGWGYDCDVIDRTIDAYIRNIRKKLRLDCITTVKGIGYKFEMGQAI